MHAPGAAVHGPYHTGSRFNGLPRPPYRIAIKELFPIVIATAVWGPFRTGKLILCHCDNAAVVTQVNKLHGHNSKADHMLKCLAFLQAVHDCWIRTVHVAGVNNPVADSLSHNRAGSGLIRHSQVSPTPTRVPPAWVYLICQQAPDSASEHRRAIFRAF